MQSLLCLFVLTFLLPTQTIAVISVPPKRPNVLILFADDLGYGDLSSYGHPTIHTPNLDKLAGNGIRFTQWYSGFHVCTPSRASMMTGRLPVRLGLVGVDEFGGVLTATSVGGLPSNETTIAESLSDQGYRTKAIGKWHLGATSEHLPTNHGFDEYFGIPYSTDMGLSAWNNVSNTELMPPLPLIKSKKEQEPVVLEQPTDLNKLSDRYTSQALDFIAPKSNVDDQPWFLYFPFNHVHVPDNVSEKFCNSTRRGRFGDALNELDDVVGKIMSKLAETNQEENTLVIFTSDNGPWLVEKVSGGSAGLLREGKQTTWEGGVRVPAIVSMKGSILPRVDRSVVATYDIFTTVINLAGGEVPKDRVIDGKDLAPLLFDDNYDEKSNEPIHDCIYHYKGSPWEEDCSHQGCTAGIWSVRCADYKLHYASDDWETAAAGGYETKYDPPLIFNIERDPSEKYPLSIDSPEWKYANATIQSFVIEHRKTVERVPNQIARGASPDARVCCDINKDCLCNPENLYDVFVCKPAGEDLIITNYY